MCYVILSLYYQCWPSPLYCRCWPLPLFILLFVPLLFGDTVPLLQMLAPAPVHPDDLHPGDLRQAGPAFVSHHSRRRLRWVPLLDVHNVWCRHNHAGEDFVNFFNYRLLKWFSGSLSWHMQQVLEVQLSIPATIFCCVCCSSNYLASALMKKQKKKNNSRYAA